MKHIQIGNDFRVSWALTQLGEAFNLVGKTYDIKVSSPYGVVLVSDVVAEDNVLSFNIPASQQVYLGNYDITLAITNEEGQTWRLKQCDAFTLVSCDCGDVVEIVQLSSGIVYPVTHSVTNNNITNNITTYGGIHIEVFGEYNISADEEGAELKTKRYLRAVIYGELENDKSYCFRLMRRRCINKGVGAKEPSEYYAQRKVGWVPTLLYPDGTGDIVRLKDWEYEGYEGVTYYDSGDKIRPSDYGYILAKSSGELVTPFNLLAPYITRSKDDEVWNAPTRRRVKKSIGVSGDNNESTCYVCNQFGIALWEEDTNGRPIRQVSNVVPVGVAINLFKFLNNPYNEGAYYWSDIG